MPVDCRHMEPPANVPRTRLSLSAPVQPQKWSSGLLSIASSDGQSTGQSIGLVAFPLHQSRKAWAVGDSAAVADWVGEYKQEISTSPLYSPTQLRCQHDAGDRWAAFRQLDCDSVFTRISTLASGFSATAIKALELVVRSGRPPGSLPATPCRFHWLCGSQRQILVSQAEIHLVAPT